VRQPTATERTLALVGYSRVSTDGQHLELQTDALREVQCDRVFSDIASGSVRDRPQLQAALDFLRAGDTLIVWRLDRLGRSLSHLLKVIEGLEERGIEFRSVTENIDTTSATGRLVLHLFGALAQFERSLLQERTKAGLAAARARGRKGGRKPLLSERQIRVVKGLHEGGDHSVSEIAALVHASRATIYRALDKGASKASGGRKRPTQENVGTCRSPAAT
jgi:DNA invertase Pin-like site-specific DNA recombinase